MVGFLRGVVGFFKRGGCFFILASSFWKTGGRFFISEWYDQSTPGGQNFIFGTIIARQAGWSKFYSEKATIKKGWQKKYERK